MAKETFVIGLGKTGLSCARYMHRHGMAARIFDSRENPPALSRLQQELPQVPYQLGPFLFADFSQAKQIIVSPGVSIHQPAIMAAKAQGIPVLGDIELFAQKVNAPVLAVTGSNGKSTVVTLLEAMAKQAEQTVKVGGNLGTPALDLLQNKGVDLYILELSSFQLETTYTLKPLAATVLNISPDHLDRYQGDIEAYSQTKQTIYTHAQHRVVNRDDPQVMAMVPTNSSNVFFGLDRPNLGAFGLASDADGEWLCQGNTRLLPVTNLRLVGRHNVANALAALGLGSVAKFPMPAMLQALKNYSGLAHRTQWIAKKEGISWYNDSKATNVGASIASLQGMPGTVVLIAGGDGKGADFGPLKKVIQAKARAVILLGRDGPLIEKAITASMVPIYQVSNMAQAVNQARNQAKSGDSVLLSPACASWDMYNGFAQRGADYIHWVREILK